MPITTEDVLFVGGLLGAPFTGGLSLLGCAPKLFGGSNQQTQQQAPAEAFNLLNKSIEEMAKMRKDLEEARQKDLEEKKKLEKNLEEVRDKINNPKLREPHETDQSLKDQEIFMIAELRKINQRIDEKDNQINTVISQQTNTTATGANQASSTIKSAN